MNVYQLFDFLRSVCTNPNLDKNPTIRARLVYRDKEGSVEKVEYAQIGYCSGLRSEITVEMNSRENGNG